MLRVACCALKAVCLSFVVVCFFFSFSGLLCVVMCLAFLVAACLLCCCVLRVLCWVLFDDRRVLCVVRCLWFGVCVEFCLLVVVRRSVFSCVVCMRC